jgi:hypothetical protein
MHTGLDEATEYTFYGWTKNPGIRNSADASATTVQNIPDSPDISLNDVPAVHMETVYAADKNVTVDVSWEPHDGAMDSSDDASNVYITGLDEAHNIYFLWLDNKFRRNQQTRRTQCNHVQNIPDSPDISLNDVSFTSMTVHMAVCRRQECHGFRRFLEPADDMDSSDASMSHIRDWTKLQQYSSMAGQRSRRNQRKLGGHSATTVQNIPDAPDISLNDVSFTSMTVHMETVYAADKNVTSFDVSWEPHDGAMDGSA